MNDHSFVLTDRGFDDFGKILENITFIELLRQGYIVNTFQLDKREVDFVITKGTEKKYLQIAYTIGEEYSKMFRREFDSLLGIKDYYSKLVLTLDDITHKPVNGIEYRNIIDYFCGN